MPTIDILKHRQWIKPLLEKVKLIENVNHENSKNYLNFEERLEKYDCFTIVVLEDDIKAMSGVYRFDDGVYRILDRTYFFGWEKSTSAFHANRKRQFLPNRTYASFDMAPYQIKYCKENDAKAVFVSLQTAQKRRILENMLKIHPVWNDFELLDGLYNTTNGVSKNSWQNIAMCTFEDYELPLQHISIEKYYELFGSKKSS